MSGRAAVVRLLVPALLATVAAAGDAAAADATGSGEPGDNPYAGIDDLYPVTLSDGELCRRTTAAFAQRRDELGVELDEVTSALAAVDREFVRACDPGRLRPGEREDCLVRYRLEREHHEHDQALNVTSFIRLRFRSQSGARAPRARPGLEGAPAGEGRRGARGGAGPLRGAGPRLRRAA